MHRQPTTVQRGRRPDERALRRERASSRAWPASVTLRRRQASLDAQRRPAARSPTTVRAEQRGGKPRSRAGTGARTAPAARRAAGVATSCPSWSGPPSRRSTTGRRFPTTSPARSSTGTSPNQLKSLPEKLAARVARHLVAAARLMDTDPETAYKHTLAARARAARVAIVREASGEAAYAAGQFKEALTEFKAARRMSGNADLPADDGRLRARSRSSRAGAWPWPRTRRCSTSTTPARSR